MPHNMPSSYSLSSLLTKFRTHAENITLAIQDEGIVIRPYASRSLPYFCLLSTSEQIDVVENISNCDAIYQEARKSGGTLKDNRLLLKTALKKFGWHIDPEFYEKIHDDHMIEIYNLNQTQVFRGFRFFCFSSYTLEDLYCRKWYHLYDRTEEDQQYMFKTVGEFLQQSPPQAMQLEPRAQRIRELATLERLSNYSTIEWLVPVTKNNLLVGILTVISCVMS
ncbi:MAG: hypothetical protein ACKOX6_11925 [Bdellovibrio sp.]